MGGDGIVGAVAGGSAARRAARGAAGGRGNDFARSSASRSTPSRLRRARERRANARSTSATSATGFLGIARSASTAPCRARVTNRRLPLGRPVYSSERCARCAGWQPADFPPRLDGDPPRPSPAARSPSPTPAMFGGGMRFVPDAALEDGLLDVVSDRRHIEGRFLRACRRCSRARTPTSPAYVPARPRGGASIADRPFTAFADGDPIADLPATVTVVPGALRVLRRPDSCSGPRWPRRAPRARCRAPRGRGGGTSLPGKVLQRVGRTRSRCSAGGWRGAAPSCRATNGKTTTAAMVAAVLERRGARLVHNRAGANMAGGVATALVAAARRPRLDGDFGLFEVDEFWLPPSSPSCGRARCCSATCFATSSTATASSRRSPTAGPASWRGAAGRRSCSTPTTRSSPTSAATCSAVYFGVEDDALALRRDAARRRLQALPPLRRPPYVYDASTSATSATTLPDWGARAPAAAGARNDVELHGTDGGVHTPDAGGRAAGAPPPRASTTSTTRSPPRRWR